MKYKCEVALIDRSIGKLLLTRDSDETTLVGRAFQDKDWLELTIQTIEKRLVRFYARPGNPQPLSDRLVGLHKNMPYNGERIGGCNFAFVDKVLFLFGESSDFGPINDDDVHKCIAAIDESIEVKRL